MLPPEAKSATKPLSFFFQKAQKWLQEPELKYLQPWNCARKLGGGLEVTNIDRKKKKQHHASFVLTPSCQDSFFHFFFFFWKGCVCSVLKFPSIPTWSFSKSNIFLESGALGGSQGLCYPAVPQRCIWAGPSREHLAEGQAWLHSLIFPAKIRCSTLCVRFTANFNAKRALQFKKSRYHLLF